jgi:hypothetical protein
MSFADLFARMKLSQTDAEVIFDRDEPVGAPTDLVMPRRRWFRRKNQEPDLPANRRNQVPSLQS